MVSITMAGAILALIGLALGAVNYPENWFYPTISYVVLTYIAGVVLLLGNSFANAVLNVMEGRPVTTREEIPEEAIERDIERELSRVIESSHESVAEFRDVDTSDIKLESAFSEPKCKGEITELEDELSEHPTLRKAETGSVELPDNDIGRVSKSLKGVLESDGKGLNKKKFRFFKR